MLYRTFSNNTFFIICFGPRLDIGLLQGIPQSLYLLKIKYSVTDTEIKAELQNMEGTKNAVNNNLNK